MPPATSPVHAPAHIKALLSRLHIESTTQESQINPADYTPIAELYKTDSVAGARAADDLMRDKSIAFDQDKSELVYQLVLAKGAKYIVEGGTSFGVSTIYLALAVAEVERLHGGARGMVVTTEHEASKCEQARRHWEECGEEVSGRIDLREGDCVNTLAQGVEMIDFLLMDLWPPAELPTLQVLLPRLKPGAIVVTDSANDNESRYPALLEVLRDPEGDFRSVTLPFKAGLEISVYVPKVVNDAA